MHGQYAWQKKEHKVTIAAVCYNTPTWQLSDHAAFAFWLNEVNRYLEKVADICFRRVCHIAVNAIAFACKYAF